MCLTLNCFYAFQVLDGHNGSSAARYVKENLMNDVLSALPATCNRDEWLASLPRALVSGFVKTDKEFQKRGYYISLLLL
jgi:serine/threonine protein phosphatase PrpC